VVFHSVTPIGIRRKEVSMSKKVVIIGGVAGGASTAARLRRLDENCEIVILERSPYISFANCGLPYYIGGSIKEREALLLQSPEAMSARFKMDIRVEHEVIEINKEDKYIMVSDLKQSTKYKEDYDILVLSPGSTPIKPSIPGIDSPNIFSLWNIPDTDRIKDYVTSRSIKQATVIGGGFIGIEMVENLHDLGIEVNLVEMADQVMAPFDFEMAQLIHSHLSTQGVHLYLKNGVKSFAYSNGLTSITLQDGKILEAEMVILSIGISPNSELARGCGLMLNKRGGIVVDQHLLTSDPSIYAVGDVVEIDDYMTKERTMIPLAGPANKQGRIVADNICGRHTVYEGTQGTSVAKVFDLTAASTGLNEKQLIRSGKSYGTDYLISVIHPKSHAGYYPGAFPMTLKLIFDRQGTILGAQNIGNEGIEKRIDVIASVMRFNATIYDLQRLELSYAPPYSSAKDPVNMVGYAAENILNNDQLPLLWREIDSLDLSTHIILDVREEIEVELGKIDGALHIPINDLRDNLDTLPKDKTIIVYCAVGVRGYIAARILSQEGFTVKNLIGGYNLLKYYDKDYTNPICVVEDQYEHMKDGTPIVTHHPVRTKELADAIVVDACGLQCPGPIMKTNERMKNLVDGDILKISATDSGFPVDAMAWAKKAGHHFIKTAREDKAYVVYIQKGSDKKTTPVKSSFNGSTMVVFSDDFDKALASMVIANGAVAMGKDVTIFFTFWGLNMLRRDNKVAVKKSLVESMFGFMMPRGSKKLKLSKMNMGGAGTLMMHSVMKQKNVNTLEELMASALSSGVKFVACTMSMDIMGIKKEELIDGIDFGGVAAYLGATDESNHNLFI
jgi:NADPH-dependent 2,4-dienoyl-CoA reductase/sulfur reductase-like enzyme/peroxiredoxin family protein/rhodanese-related sulfurtransferase/TusA-related sulfurtransferase